MYIYYNIENSIELDWYTIQKINTSYTNNCDCEWCHKCDCDTTTVHYFNWYFIKELGVRYKTKEEVIKAIQRDKFFILKKQKKKEDNKKRRVLKNKKRILSWILFNKEKVMLEEWLSLIEIFNKRIDIF